MIDKVAKRAHNFSSFSSKRVHHEIVTQINLMRVLSQKTETNNDKKRQKNLSIAK